MKPGRQWLVFDANFFDNSFTHALLERFGPVGTTLFLAFLCACKLSRLPGRISYRNDEHCLDMLGLEGLRLVDQDGRPFTMDEFFTFTGRYKQTSRTARGHTFYVSATHWEQWQNDRNTLLARERKRRSRANSERDNVTPERDSDRDIYSDKRDTSRKGNYQPTPPRIEEWFGDEPADEPLVDIRSVIAQLRRGEEPDG